MLHYPDIDPIALELGFMSIRWYGLMYLFGFLLAFGYCIWHRHYTVPPFTTESIADLLFYAAVGVILGGSMGYWLFYEPTRILSDPFILFKFWLPGRSFHGGLIGVIVAVLLYCHFHQRRFFEVMDFLAPAVPIGLGLGRLGNFLNGELWGRVTDVSWGMVFPHAGSNPRHPSQLYEFFLEGIVLFLILHFYARKPRPDGAVSGLFAIGYGVFRSFVEFFREPEPIQGFVAWGTLTKGQALSIPMILIGIFLMLTAYKKVNFCGAWGCLRRKG